MFTTNAQKAHTSSSVTETDPNVPDDRFAGDKRTSPSVVARSSKALIVLAGAPLMKAQGASCSVSAIENHLDFEVTTSLASCNDHAEQQVCDGGRPDLAKTHRQQHRTTAA